MSDAVSRCPGCGSSNIVDDAFGCNPQLVCADCGNVLSEGGLTNGDNPVGTDVSYSRSVAVARKPCLNLVKGLQRLKAMCRILRVHKEIEELSHVYYTDAYQHESFIQVSLQKKEVLAGCCLLVSCRLRNWPIAMTTISCLLDVDPMTVGAIYKEMVRILHIEAPLVCITDVIEAHAQEYKISSLDVPEELAENSKDLTKRAVALVELAADAWIVTGRKPIPIMMAAIYLAWQSLKPSKHRLKLSLDKFCQVAKVNKHKPATKRITEMKDVLCKLGNEIPWLSEAVTPSNVVRQLGDILQYRFALLRKAIRTHETISQTSELEAGPTLNAFAAEQCELNAERSSDSDDRPCTVPELQSDNKDQPGPEPNWGKRVLFAPPCVIKPKKRRMERPEQPEVTGYEEISDSEIDSYIRTPREAREFALTQNLLAEREKL